MLYPAVVRTLGKYSAERVRQLIDTTKQVATALHAVRDSGCTRRRRPRNSLEATSSLFVIAMERGGISEPPIVLCEATAALAMLLLQDYGVLTVHFVGVPPGGPDLLFKFIPPETLRAYGGPEAFAKAVDASLTKLATFVADPEKVRALLLGDG